MPVISGVLNLDAAQIRENFSNLI